MHNHLRHAPYLDLHLDYPLGLLIKHHYHHLILKAIWLPIPDDAPKIKQSTKITQKYNPLDSNYVPQSHNLSHNAKPTKTRSMNPYLIETKPNPTAARVPLHREIKCDISKFIHNITSTHAPNIICNLIIFLVPNLCRISKTKKSSIKKCNDIGLLV